MLFFRLLNFQTDLISLFLPKSSWIRTKVGTLISIKLTAVLLILDFYPNLTIFPLTKLLNSLINPVLSSISAVLAREAELRRLRKANIEFEEQNRVLQKHIKDMYNAKERLEAELGMDEKRTQALHQHLLTIKQTLVSSLSTVPLPGQKPAARV